MLKTAILKGRPYSTLRAPGCSRGRGPPCSLPQCFSLRHPPGRPGEGAGCGWTAAGLGPPRNLCVWVEPGRTQRKGPWRASLRARSQADLWLSGQDSMPFPASSFFLRSPSLVLRFLEVSAVEAAACLSPHPPSFQNPEGRITRGWCHGFRGREHDPGPPGSVSASPGWTV